MSNPLKHGMSAFKNPVLGIDSARVIDSGALIFAHFSRFAVSGQMPLTKQREW